MLIVNWKVETVKMIYDKCLVKLKQKYIRNSHYKTKVDRCCRLTNKSVDDELSSRAEQQSKPLIVRSVYQFYCDKKLKLMVNESYIRFDKSMRQIPLTSASVIRISRTGHVHVKLDDYWRDDKVFIFQISDRIQMSTRDRLSTRYVQIFINAQTSPQHYKKSFDILTTHLTVALVEMILHYTG